MRKQLPKFLQYFYPIPSVVSCFIAFVGIIFTSASTKSTEFYPFLILTILATVALIAKIIADGKIKKLRTGINPLYLVEKYHKDLDAQCNDLINQKYELKEKTSTTAHFEKRPYFSVITAIFLFLLGVLPGVVYLIYYFLLPKE